MTLDEEARALLVRLTELERWIAAYLAVGAAERRWTDAYLAIERQNLMRQANSPAQDIEARALSTYAETIRGQERENDAEGSQGGDERPPVLGQSG